MKTWLLFLLILSLPSTSWAQADTTSWPRKHLLQADIGLTSLPVPRDRGLGFTINFLYQPWPRSNVSTGFAMTIGQVRSSDSFGYTVAQPTVFLLDLGWINQIRLVKANRFAVDASLTSSLLITKLGDWAKPRTVYTRYGRTTEPTYIKTDAYFALEPGCRLTYHLTPYRSDGVSLFAWALYRFTYGVGGFSTASELTAPVFITGLMISGYSYR
ncbi:hypothetical protein [Fibrella aquatilis]|uniref:Outer membrane protein beta-barrel domain-containing protein n=1 Tax=Fibrella aquatilis TaxID=2817059 RepID=A0A939JY07_9BACT|nr:hypothetical protein [Fibrella aquatilis]MBO0931584.1 hypothetical protein [Fibrella aquatilis]